MRKRVGLLTGLLVLLLSSGVVGGYPEEPFFDYEVGYDPAIGIWTAPHGDLELHVLSDDRWCHAMATNVINIIDGRAEQQCRVWLKWQRTGWNTYWIEGERSGTTYPVLIPLPYANILMAGERGDSEPLFEWDEVLCLSCEVMWTLPDSIDMYRPDRILSSERWCDSLASRPAQDVYEEDWAFYPSVEETCLAFMQSLANWSERNPSSESDWPNRLAIPMTWANRFLSASPCAHTTYLDGDCE